MMADAGKVSIIFTGGVTPELAAQFQTVCAEVAGTDVSRLSIMIGSRGGDVTSGLAIYNTLRLMRCPVRTVNMGQCGSIAATVYLAGSVRQSMPAASFLLHAATYIEGPDKGKVAPNTGLILAPFRDQLDWGQDLLDRHFTSAAETYLSNVEAKALGIITDSALPNWSEEELAVVLNPHGNADAAIDRFIDRLHSRARRATESGKR